MHKSNYLSSVFVSFVAAFAFTVFAGACSVPDDPTYDRLESGVRMIEVRDPETWTQLIRMKAIDNFRQFYQRNWYEHATDRIVTFHCTDSWTKDNIANGYTSWGFTLQDVWNCVGGNYLHQRTFPECVADLLNAATDMHREQLFKNFGVYPELDDVSCKPIYYFLHESPPVEDFDPANVKAEDVSHEMIESKTPPSWIKLLGITINAWGLPLNYAGFFPSGSAFVGYAPSPRVSFDASGAVMVVETLGYRGPGGRFGIAGIVRF